LETNFSAKFFFPAFIYDKSMMNDELFNFLSVKFEFLSPKNRDDEVSNFEKNYFDEIRLIYFYKI